MIFRKRTSLVEGDASAVEVVVAFHCLKQATRCPIGSSMRVRV
jgi:hypothetical protein